MALETGTYISDLISTNPTGADNRSTADDHIRLIKATILATFPNITGAITATHTELNSLVDLFDSVTTTATQFNYLNSTTGVAGGGTVIDMLASGTLMTFQQTSAPTGWTKQTTHNNKALRVVSGTASSGGTDNFSTVFANTSTDSYTLLEADIPAHTHGSAGAHTHGLPVFSGEGSSNVISGYSSNQNPNFILTSDSSGTHTHTSFGGDGGHSHGLSNFDIQYVDLIIASKN